MDDDIQHCVIYRLQPGAGPEYDARHEQVWPEVVDELKAEGISDYSIFRRGDLVISVFRTTGPLGSAASRSEDAGDSAAIRWSKSLHHLFESTEDEQGRALKADRIFRLDDLGGHK